MTFNSAPYRRAARVLGLVFAVGGACAQATAQQGAAPSRADRKFVEDAAMSGAAEIQLSQIAQKNASSSKVKQFADHMVQDHQKANTELQQVASGKGMQVPAEVGSAHKKMADKLAKVNGPDFDAQYMTGMVADHKKVVALFQKEAQSGTDPELKAYAGKMLPALQEHLQMAQSLQPSTSAGKGSGSGSGSGMSSSNSMGSGSGSGSGAGSRPGTGAGTGAGSSVDTNGTGAVGVQR